MYRPLALLMLLALPAAASAQLQTRPFQGTLGYTTTSLVGNTATATLAGPASVLGQLTGEASYTINPDFSFTGTITKRAANGDLLYETLVGQFTPTGSFGTFSIVGGTGRFAHASGGGTFVGTWLDPYLIHADILIDATLTYDASDRR